MNNRRKTALLVAIMLLIGLFAIGCKSEDQIEEQKLITTAAEKVDYYDSRSTVTVYGEGKVTLDPNLATVGFRVYANDKDVSEAQQKNAELSKAVMEAIKARGIAEDDIETGQLMINEVYDYSNNTHRIAGYDVYYQITVTVRDISILGSLMSEVVAAGASDITGPNYSIEEDTDAYLTALSLAVEAATAKANAIAAGAGVKLSPLPISLNEGGNVNYAVNTIMYDRAEAAPAEEAAADYAEVEISTPKIEVTARVDAVYQITR